MGATFELFEPPLPSSRPPTTSSGARVSHLRLSRTRHESICAGIALNFKHMSRPLVYPRLLDKHSGRAQIYALAY